VTEESFELASGDVLVHYITESLGSRRDRVCAGVDAVVTENGLSYPAAPLEPLGTAVALGIAACRLSGLDIPPELVAWSSN